MLKNIKFHLPVKSLSKRARWILYPTAAVAFLNFLVYWTVSLYLGGDALNGYIKAGEYFVCAHGACGQVSSEIWHYSYWHAISAISAIFLVLGEATVLINTKDITIDWDST